MDGVVVIPVEQRECNGPQSTCPFVSIDSDMVQAKASVSQALQDVKAVGCDKEGKRDSFWKKLLSRVRRRKMESAAVERVNVEVDIKPKSLEVEATQLQEQCRVGPLMVVDPEAEVLSKPADALAATSSFSQGVFNCTSLLLGLGLLSSSYAVAQTGWLGAVLCVAFAAANAYAAHLLAACQRKLGCRSYQDIARASVGRFSCFIIQVLFYLQVTGTVLGYCISIADNLNQLFPTAAFSLPALSFRDILLLIACIVVLPTVWMRDLSGLAFTSIWSVAAAVLLVIVVLISAGVDHIGFHHTIPIANVNGAPIAAGLYAFAFSGTTCFPNVYRSMKDPSRFTQVLMWSFGITTFFIFVLGLAGAYMFGKATASQITLSMPDHRITTKIVLWATVLTPLLKFALVLAPVSEAMDTKLNHRFHDRSEKVKTVIRTSARSGLMAFIVIVAITLPYFNYVIALIGSFVAIGICLLFPFYFYVKLCRENLTYYSIGIILFTTIFASIAAVCGTIISFRGLIDSKRQHKS
ncbi:hypothetical protein KP509_29G037000 [Ceratopteris richardii]|uniref:Amino acid transporter transmembrane domain-containing protein n=1 Tax=Ceratopteris richardii TaxID=49495 RepID=A0A8T2R600_CERRI|nr:hypothetical protein KP509_29G037000 [Ceratopteris richardii]